ncbi:MarR family winged helix-turn-helix transcriptional regulator [Kutzneria albida]|uniref:HTH marR-type domain-containing protein n=1 Tax=Kutzneria albida DSM 43870 TaxID=1449976 RepID=W5WBT9_9PSEU|nr:MarR family transcriptional regulator [Kutzneria albida]AHH95654.1 hypothetical protein KALB_2285 [Kutzneria albida DSM 43870]
MAQSRDHIDDLTDHLVGTHSPEELAAKALAYRLRRVAHRLETEIKRELAPHGIELWELELLACLRRAEPKQRLTAGELMTQMQLTSGAVTNRVSQLERKGWVSRQLDESDRRVVLVALTEQGRERATQVFGTKTRAELAMLSALDPERQARMNEDLRTLLISLEGSH